MRRIIFGSCGVMAIMAAMLVAMAMPAFAVASSNANCLGQGVSADATSDGRAAGEGFASFARANQGTGQEVSPIVSTPPCNPI